MTEAWATFLRIWATPGVSEFSAAMLGGFFVMAAQYLALRHDREKEAQRLRDEGRAQAWSVYFKISQAHEAICSAAKEIATAKAAAQAQGLELWQLLQFPPHDWEVVSWENAELVFLIDHQQFELMQRYQEAIWWLSNLVQSVKLYREMRTEFVRGTPSDVRGDGGTIVATPADMRLIMPTIVHLRSLSTSLEQVIGQQSGDVRNLLKEYAGAMKDLCGHRPQLEFTDEST